MRFITTANMIAALLFVAGGTAVADTNGNSTKLRLQPVNVSGDSDAELLAERHLALYRTAQLQALQSAATADGGAGVEPPVTFSAIAALPLPPRSPVPPKTDQ